MPPQAGQVGHLRSSGASFDEILVFVDGVLHRGLPIESGLLDSVQYGQTARNWIQGDKNPLLDALSGSTKESVTLVRCQ